MGRAVTELSTHIFELDLTSVCVSSGTIQLPLKMLQLFVPGRVPAEVDGHDLDLEFLPPRRLSGLREHFAERGLRPNDRVRFELEVADGAVVALKATCVRRERPKPQETVAAGQGRAPHVDKQTEPWGSAGTVKAVKRVRIPGLPVAHGPAVLHAAPSREAGGDVEDRAGEQPTGAWAALHEREVYDEGLTTVRAVRRRGSRAPLQPDTAPSSAAEPAQPPAAAELPREVVRPIGASPSLRPTPQVQLSDLIAPPIEDPGYDAGGRRPRRWALMPRLRGGVPTMTRQPYTSGPARQARDEEPEVPQAPEVDSDVAVGKAREAPVTSAPTAPPGPRPARDERSDAAGPEWQAGKEKRVLVEAITPAAAKAALPTPPTPAPRAQPPQADAARALRGSAQVTGRPQERPLAFSDAPGLGDEDDGWREARRSEPAQARPTSEPPSGGAMLIDDADFGGEYLAPQPPARSSAGTSTGSLESDIALVGEYLHRPGTPAIVRSDAVGELLGIGAERAERALERISEAPDSVSRIRRGAYMVRRRPS